MDYMTTCSDKKKNLNNQNNNQHNNNQHNNNRERKTKAQKLNNTVGKIKNTIEERSSNKIKNYFPESPNIIINLSPLEYPESGIEKLDLESDLLISRFQEITADNLKDINNSNLVTKRFDMTNHKVEVTNTEEFDLIKNFLEKEIYPELDSDIENISQSNVGKIIMYGYLRYLQKESYLTFNFHHIFKECHQNKNTWYQIDSIHEKLLVCFSQKPNQFQENIDDRYNFVGCLEIAMIKSNQDIRIPFYVDKNGEIGFPSMRKIGKFYFTIFHISDIKELYLDYDIEKQNIYLVSDENQELVRYICSEKGIAIHEELPEYLNVEFKNELDKVESKHTKLE